MILLETHRQNISKKTQPIKEGFPFSNYFPFEILAPGPSAEPSGIQNSQSTLCVAVRPFFILQLVAGDTCNYFVTLLAPNSPQPVQLRCGCMELHYFGGSRPSADFKQKKPTD